MNHSVVENIHEKYHTMTKKQRQLADYMLNNAEAMCFMTLKELATATGVSEMTVLHACTALGYNNYNDLKYEFRKYLSSNSRIEVQRQNNYSIPTVPGYELNDKRNLMVHICQEEYELYHKFFSEIESEALFQAARMMLDASNTMICARGSSIQAAEFLSMRLATMSVPSVIVNTEFNDSIQAALPLFNSSVLTVAISMPDYYMMTTRMCEYAAQRHSRILCLTDSHSAPIARYGEMVLLAPTTTRLFLNTVGPMLSLVNLLSSAVNIEKSIRKSNRFNSGEEFAKLFADQDAEKED